MIALISGDEYCYKLDGRYYLSTQGVILTKRYLAVFDQIKLVLRTKTVNNVSELEKYSNKVDTSRVEIIPLPFFQGPREYAKVFFSVRRCIKLFVGSCDVAILRLPSTTAFAVWHEIRRTSLPYATEVVFDCYDAYISSKNLFHKIIWSILHKWQVKACNDAIGVSCVTEHYLQRRYFPVSPDSLTSHYSSAEIPQDFFYQARQYPRCNKFRIVHIANQVQFNSRKGHNQLIEVLSVLQKSGYVVDLVFVGEDYNDGIRQLSEYAASLDVKTNLSFSGFLSHDEMRDVLLDSDMLILPTKAEGLPRVVIEAMALGLPCITSPVSGNSELVSADLLFAYNDVEGMANKVIELIGNEEYYEKVSLENYTKAQSYSADVLNQRRCEFYRGLKSKVISLRKSVGGGTSLVIK